MTTTYLSCEEEVFWLEEEDEFTDCLCENEDDRQLESVFF